MNIVCSGSKPKNSYSEEIILEKIKNKCKSVSFQIIIFFSSNNNDDDKIFIKYDQVFQCYYKYPFVLYCIVYINKKTILF